jgi:hypothetical protein
MEDLEAVWKLVEADGFTALFRRHAEKYDPDEWRAIKARERAEYQRQKEIERQNAKPSKYGMKQAGRYMTRYRIEPKRDISDLRLIESVKADKALDLITQKKAKLVNKPGQLVATTVYVPYKSRKEREAEQRAKNMAKYGIDIYAAPNKNVPKAGTNKRLGNSY